MNGIEFPGTTGQSPTSGVMPDGWHVYFDSANDVLFINGYEFPIFCTLCAVIASGTFSEASVLKKACSLLGPERQQEIAALFSKYGDASSSPMWRRRDDGTYEVISAGCHLG